MQTPLQPNDAVLEVQQWDLFPSINENLISGVWNIMRDKQINTQTDPESVAWLQVSQSRTL